MNNEILKERFPNAHFHPSWHLVTWHPKGVLDNERADHVVDFVEMREKMNREPFHRYVDMTGYTRIQIELDHVVRLALRRKRLYQGPPVKSAFYAVRLVSVAVMRMYQEILEGTPLIVGTFRDRAAAADWLGVPEAVLKAPKPEVA